MDDLTIARIVHVVVGLSVVFTLIGAVGGSPGLF